MNFTFCDEIKTYLKENKTITINVNCDYKLFEYVKSELEPYIVLTDEVSDKKLDLNDKMGIKFYKNANTIIDTVKENLYKQLEKEGWLKVHSAVVKKDGLAVIFIASTQKGKSSSEFLLGSKENTSFISNDISFIHPTKPIVVGYPSGFGLAPFSAKYLNLYDKSKIIDETGVWFSSTHMREMGKKIEAISEIGEIIFIDFHKGKEKDEFYLLGRCMFEELLNDNIFNNNKLSINNLKSVKMLEIKTIGLSSKYEELLDKIIKSRGVNNGKVLKKIL